MKRINIDQDIRPLSDFRSGVTKYLCQVSETKRPLVITQHGLGVAVLLDVAEYEALQEKIECLEDINSAELPLKNGEGITHKKAKASVLKTLKN